MKKRKAGFCRICGNWARLTDDHVPPKGCNNSGEIPVYSFLNNSLKHKYTNGIVLRTLCESCNSKLLGNLYDPELIKFSKEVIKYFYHYNFGQIVFKKFYLRIDINKVARSIIGHLLASIGNDTNIKEPIDQKYEYFNKMRTFFLQNDQEFQRNFKIVYWVHKFRSIDIIPVMNYGSFEVKNSVVLCSVLKYFPLGFWIIDRNEMYKHFSLNLPDLFDQIDNSVLVDYGVNVQENFPISLLDSELKMGLFLLDHDLAKKGVKSRYYMNTEIIKIK